MRADICDPSDKASVEKFTQLLQRLGGHTADRGWGMGVDVYHIDIQGERLTVYSDSWSIDIEGPDELVCMVVREYQQGSS